MPHLGVFGALIGSYLRCRPAAALVRERKHCGAAIARPSTLYELKDQSALRLLLRAQRNW